ncbi:triadin [Guaruba guarouba]
MQPGASKSPQCPCLAFQALGRSSGSSTPYLLGHMSTTTTIIDGKNESVPSSSMKVGKKSVMEDLVTTFSSPAAWLLVVALIVTWSAVAIVMFDLVDYKAFAATYSQHCDDPCLPPGRSVHKLSTEPLRIIHETLEESTDWLYGFFSLLSDIVWSDDDDSDEGEVEPSLTKEIPKQKLERHEKQTQPKVIQGDKPDKLQKIERKEPLKVTHKDKLERQDKPEKKEKQGAIQKEKHEKPEKHEKKAPSKVIQKDKPERHEKAEKKPPPKEEKKIKSTKVESKVKKDVKDGKREAKIAEKVKQAETKTTEVGLIKAKPKVKEEKALQTVTKSEKKDQYAFCRYVIDMFAQGDFYPGHKEMLPPRLLLEHSPRKKPATIEEEKSIVVARGVKKRKDEKKKTDVKRATTETKKKEKEGKKEKAHKKTHVPESKKADKKEAAVSKELKKPAKAPAAKPATKNAAAAPGKRIKYLTFQGQMLEVGYYVYKDRLCSLFLDKINLYSVTIKCHNPIYAMQQSAVVLLTQKTGISSRASQGEQVNYEEEITYYVKVKMRIKEENDRAFQAVKKKKYLSVSLKDSFVFRVHYDYTGVLWKECASPTSELIETDILKRADRLAAYSTKKEVKVHASVETLKSKGAPEKKEDKATKAAEQDKQKMKQGNPGKEKDSKSPAATKNKEHAKEKEEKNPTALKDKDYLKGKNPKNPEGSKEKETGKRKDVKPPAALKEKDSSKGKEMKASTMAKEKAAVKKDGEKKATSEKPHEHKHVRVKHEKADSSQTKPEEKIKQQKTTPIEKSGSANFHFQSVSKIRRLKQKEKVESLFSLYLNITFYLLLSSVVQAKPSKHEAVRHEKDVLPTKPEPTGEIPTAAMKKTKTAKEKQEKPIEKKHLKYEKNKEVPRVKEASRHHNLTSAPVRYFQCVFLNGPNGFELQFPTNPSPSKEETTHSKTSKRKTRKPGQ